MENIRDSLGRVPTFLLYFFLGQTGFVRKESSFVVAWTIGILVAGAVLLGTPDTEASYCNDWLPNTSCTGPEQHGYCADECWDRGPDCPDGICKWTGLYYNCFCCYPGPCGMK